MKPFADLLTEFDMSDHDGGAGFGGQKFLDVVVPKIRGPGNSSKGRDLDIWVTQGWRR